MTRIETARYDAQVASPTRPSRRRRWVAAASCVSLVAVIAGGGYWSNYVYLSDLTALDAWNRYMDLVKDGKYNDAVRYFPELVTLFDDKNSRDFLTDAAHAHAPSKVTFEGRAVPNNSTENEGIRTEIEARFDSTPAEVTPTTSTCISMRPRGGTVSSACGRSTPFRMDR